MEPIYIDTMFIKKLDEARSFCMQLTANSDHYGAHLYLYENSDALLIQCLTESGKETKRVVRWKYVKDGIDNLIIKKAKDGLRELGCIFDEDG